MKAYVESYGYTLINTCLIALGYGLDEYRQVLGILLFTTASGLTLGPTQPSIKWVPGALFLRVKRPGRETDRSPPSTTKVKECMELCVHFPDTPSWRGAPLNKSTGITLLYSSGKIFYTSPNCLQP
jgi:hypothetical protein